MFVTRLRREAGDDMSVKSVVKDLLQRVVLSGPVYARLRAAALRRPATYVPDAREILERVDPRPEHMRAEAAPMPAPTVDLTVIVPVYNVERYVGECLESILSQELDGRSLEVIVVDDGSTDESAAIVSEIAKRDGRVRFMRGWGQGPAARNAGLDAARGSHIAFVDSDDRLAPGHFARLFERIEVGDVDFVSGLWRRIDEDGRDLGLGELRRAHVTVWGRLYLRKVWERLRFPQGCWYEDIIVATCVQPLFSEAQIGDAGYLYRVRRNSVVSSTANSKALDAYWVLEETLGWRGDLGISYDQADLDRLLPIMGPTLMGRGTVLDEHGMRALFSLHCDLLASLEELADVHTSRGGCWPDVELALRERRFERWCLACAAVAAESRDVKIMTALSYFREAMRQR